MKNIQLKYVFHLFTVCIFTFLIGCGGSEKTTTAPPKQVKAASTSSSNNQATSKPAKQEESTQSAEDEDDEEIDFEDMDIEDVEVALQKYLKDSKFKEAKTPVQVLLEDDSEPLKYHFYSGKIYFELKEYNLAMDEFSHIVTELKEAEEEELEFSKDELDSFLKRALVISEDLKLTLPNLGSDKETSDLVIMLLKLNPELSFDGIKVKSGKSLPKTYYIVKSLKYYQDVLREDRSFWSYYNYSFLNFKMKWYSDANKNIDKALTLADTQAQIFFALMLQGQIQVVAPKGKQSELDKLSALDLTEDMLDEFLGKYSKTLNEKQMEKARVMMNKAMKLKAKLDKAEDDSSRLVLLKQFIVDAGDLLTSKDFPPDITKKIESAQKKSNRRMAELEEQIRIKKEVE
jgi:tetratricopeptide (TPR) repeat protein